VKESEKIKRVFFFFSVHFMLEDEGRLEVLESPLFTVWECWVAAGWGTQVE